MELKDVILSTLAEMEDNETTKKVLNSSIQAKKVNLTEKKEKNVLRPELSTLEPLIQESETSASSSEIQFLNSLRERLLVLFEGFQAPNNTNIEAKVDMTLNFLEYALATIDLRAQQIEKGRQK